MRLRKPAAVGWLVFVLMHVWTFPICVFAYLNRAGYVGTVDLGPWRFKVYNYRWWPWPRYSIFAWPFMLHDGNSISIRLVDHESEGHGIQQMALGPLFLPLYLLGLVVGYRLNPFEHWARQMEERGHVPKWVDGPNRQEIDS